MEVDVKVITALLLRILPALIVMFQFNISKWIFINDFFKFKKQLYVLLTEIIFIVISSLPIIYNGLTDYLIFLLLTLTANIFIMIPYMRTSKS